MGKRIGSRFRNVVPSLGATDASRKEIESWYEDDFLAHFNTHLESQDYLLGNRPSIGDYGLMGPLYAHLYRDPKPGEIMKSKAPNVAKWVERMNNPSATQGDFLSDDAIADTLLPILKRMFKEHWPVLLDTHEKLSQWVQSQPSSVEPLKIPRMLGKHTFKIGAIEEQRLVLPYSLWMWQRPLEFYHQLNELEKKSVDSLLHELGGYEAMQIKPRCTVIRKNNQFFVESTT